MSREQTERPRSWPSSRKPARDASRTPAFALPSSRANRCASAAAAASASSLGTYSSFPTPPAASPALPSTPPSPPPSPPPPPPPQPPGSQRQTPRPALPAASPPPSPSSVPPPCASSGPPPPPPPWRCRSPPPPPWPPPPRPGVPPGRAPFVFRPSRPFRGLGPAERSYRAPAADLLSAARDDPLEPVLASLLEESFSARLASSTAEGVNDDEERQKNGVAVSVNPLYAAGSPLHAAFVAACRRNPSLEVEVVFHGTADSNVDAISENGLDPARRGQHGQSLGPGEYFARDPLISLSYCQRHGGLRQGAGPTRMLIFAVLIDPRNDGVPTFARKDFGGSSPIVVVPQADHQLPIGVLTLRPGEEAMGQATSVVNALMRKAKAASDAAAVAEKQASAAESFARVCQLLIREDLDAAAVAYQAAIASDAASTSSWAHALSFYLRKYRLEPSLVQAMFPGVEGVEVDAGGNNDGGLGSLGSASRAVSKRPFDGTVEELKASATAKRAEADVAQSRWRAASSSAASSAGSNPARAGRRVWVCLISCCVYWVVCCILLCL
mmetsp:Transcript_20543/g.65439  ORF Transcript_20543/g.65439 Transcript_20543/m.65439 type:complete len:555 (-) Transcript_20543:496-2160(-)